MIVRRNRKVPQHQERVNRMKEEYMELHAQGWGPKRIAHHFDLASCTVYNALQEIADANGVSRESLLQQPHAPHTTYERSFQPVRPVDLTDFRIQFQNTDADLTRMIGLCVSTITESERSADCFEQEEAKWHSDRC